jgi:hypothetical protein
MIKRKGLLVAYFAFCLLLFLPSCALDPEAVEIFGGDVVVPKLIDVIPLSTTAIVARFSVPVTVESSSVILEDSSVIDSSESTYDSCALLFTLAQPLSVGARAKLSAIVEDSNGNSLSFIVPFFGYNDHPSKLKINEVRTCYSKPKVEFIEFIALCDGNLGGIEIVNAMNAVDPSYQFPAVEVKSGDYIVYHLRSVEENLVDETLSVTASSGIDARATARDFWDDLTKAPLKPTNVILVRERKGGAIMDALLCAESGVDEWPTDAVLLAAEEAVAAGAWKPDAQVSSSFCSSGTTTTRTLGRSISSPDTDTSADWSICATSKCSPGGANNGH